MRAANEKMPLAAEVDAVLNAMDAHCGANRFDDGMASKR
jgi:hypothetical protein